MGTGMGPRSGLPPEGYVVAMPAFDSVFPMMPRGLSASFWVGLAVNVDNNWLRPELSLLLELLESPELAWAWAW